MNTVKTAHGVGKKSSFIDPLAVDSVVILLYKIQICSIARQKIYIW